MASVIKIKRSSTATAVPGSLEVGELAVNLFDRKLYVGNTTGVTAIGGEDFRLTTQDSGSEGAYIKLLGDSVLSTNSVFIEAGEGVDITRQSNGSITIAGEDATTSNKGIASFDTTSFTVSSGAVSAKDLTLNGDSGSAAATIGESMTIAGTDAQGIDTSATGTTVTITAKDATSSQKGVASFDSTSFTVSSGAVDLAAGGVYNAKLQNPSYTLATNGTGADLTVALGETLNINEGEGIDVTFAANTITIAAEDASTSNKGVASFDSGDFSVSSGAVSLADSATGAVIAINGTTNEVDVSRTNGTVTVGLPNDVTIGNDLTVTNDLSVQGAVTIDGNLTVEGALTYISTSTVYADDGMFKLSANNSGDSVDTGIYAKYVDGATPKFAGYFRDAGDGVFKFYEELQAEPTTTVDVNGTGYALAQVDCVIDGGTY
jgi:hypothetical protein